jgi:uncharacterized membrane protein
MPILTVSSQENMCIFVAFRHHRHAKKWIEVVSLTKKQIKAATTTNEEGKRSKEFIEEHS